MQTLYLFLYKLQGQMLNLAPNHRFLIMGL